MEQFPITAVPKNDERYPRHLAATAGMPETLYVRGNLEVLGSTCIAIVGTRKVTEYGRQSAEHIASSLSRSKITIVSGLALGVDAIAHRATLNSGGTTIAVLGSGIDDETIGPRQNFPLAQDILAKGGAIVSEYAPGFPADRWTFPARNRIISGLSRGVVIVEADIKSGALITARHAADQGRDVFAVPGSIFWPRSSGPNSLIQQGAKAVLAPRDILEEYGLESEPQHTAVSTHDPVQARIAAILENGPLHADSIITSSGLPASQVMISLSMMELAEIVVRTENGHYRKHKP